MENIKSNINRISVGNIVIESSTASLEECSRILKKIIKENKDFVIKSNIHIKVDPLFEDDY